MKKISRKISDSSEEQRMFDFSILRELRKGEKMTIGDLSKRSGISGAVISRLERNQSMADLSTIYRLARVFGLNPSDLMSLAESRSAHRKKASVHRSSGFEFKEISYANVRCLIGDGTAGAETSRPEMHRDDYELCWVLKGVVEITLPHESQTLKSGESLQFDAMLVHSYRVIEDCRILIVHIRKGKRF